MVPVGNGRDLWLSFELSLLRRLARQSNVEQIDMGSPKSRHRSLGPTTTLHK
jgi:hypothetical protein